MPEHHLSQLQDVAMTAPERERIRNRLRAYTVAHTPRLSVPLSAWRWATRHGVFALGIAALVLTAGTGVSASWAHPGDALYGFRLSVNDRIETALVFNDEARIDREMQQMQRMIDDEDAAAASSWESFGESDATDAIGSAEDDFEAELEDIEREVRDEQADTDDDTSDGDEEDVSDVPRSPKSADESQLEQELKNISRELEDEEDRSGRELE